jgi:hypothetical protein
MHEQLRPDLIEEHKQSVLINNPSSCCLGGLIFHRKNGWTLSRPNLEQPSAEVLLLSTNYH